MAGFLDKDMRVIDMVLTGEGRYLLSRGELRFVYWSPFDDEVDYSPYLSTSGSMNAAQLSSSVDQQIDYAPVREATTGYRRTNRSGSDETNVRCHLFTGPQGQIVLPRMTASSGPTGSIDIEVKQRKVSRMLTRHDVDGNVVEQLGPYDAGFEKFDTSVFTVDYGFSRQGFPVGHPYDGFLVRVFRSGAEGLVEVKERRDTSNDITFDGHLVVGVDTGER